MIITNLSAKSYQHLLESMTYRSTKDFVNFIVFFSCFTSYVKVLFLCNSCQGKRSNMWTGKILRSFADSSWNTSFNGFEGNVQHFLLKEESGGTNKLPAGMPCSQQALLLHNICHIGKSLTDIQFYASTTLVRQTNKNVQIATTLRPKICLSFVNGRWKCVLEDPPLSVVLWFMSQHFGGL